MKLYQLKEILTTLESYGYSQSQVFGATSGQPFLWVFREGDRVVLKTALDFDANDLRTYAEQYYISGKSPYANDEEFAEHLMESGISQDLVREALGETWSALYFRIVSKRLERKVHPITEGG